MAEHSPGSFYQHGWQSWNVAAWRPPNVPVRYPVVASHRLQSTDPVHLDDPCPGGASLGAVVLDDGQVELLGALGIDAWVTLEDGVLKGDGDCQWFRSTGDEGQVFADYAIALKEALGARGGGPGRVWCSWYSFYNTVGEAALASVLKGMDDLPFDIVQIDDGWQLANGDWQANASFPGGMQKAAAAIRESGRTPGLWLAPFMVAPDSMLYRDYPQMVLRDPDGDPVIAAHNWGPSYTLDVTRDDSRAWLAQTMSNMVAMGYKYLKLDFLYAAALPGQYHVDMGREDAYRQASQLIRDAVGEDVYLLACGAPVVPSVGIYDGLRVGPDVSEFWDNVDRTLHLADRAGPGGADAITTTLGRLWLKPLIDVDPDIAYFRSRYCMLSGEQKRHLCDLANICGFKANSDVPDWLLPAERARLKHFLDYSPEVESLGGYRFRLDDRTVDFSAIVAGRPW